MPEQRAASDVSPRARRVARFVLLLLCELCVTATFFFGAHERVGGIALALVMLARRLLVRARPDALSAPAQGLALTLVSALVGVVTVHPDSGAEACTLALSVALFVGAALVTIGTAFDAFYEEASRAARLVAASSIVSIYLASLATWKVTHWVLDRPYFSNMVIAEIAVLATFATVVTLRAFLGAPEARERACVACVVATFGFALLLAWVPWAHSFFHGGFHDSYHLEAGRRRTTELIWLVPLGWLCLLVLFAPALRRTSAVVLGAWLAEWIAMWSIDRFVPTAYPDPWHLEGRRLRFAADEEVTSAWDREGRVTVDPRDDYTRYDLSFVVGRASWSREMPRCDETLLDYIANWRVLHPNDVHRPELALLVGDDARDTDLATCVHGLTQKRIESVALLALPPSPLPPWSALHRLMHLRRPLTEAAHGPVAGLLCTPGEEGCTREGVVSLARLDAMTATRRSVAASRVAP